MIKKLRFTFEYLFYYLRHNLVYIIAGLIVGALIFLKRDFLVATYVNLSQPPVIIGREGLYTFSNLPNDITSQISFGLTQADPDGKMELSPLVSHLDIKNNNQTYIFTLQPDYFWHNRKKFTASDIKLKIPGTQIKATSDTTLEITFDSPFAPALSLFNQPLFLEHSTVGLGTFQVSRIEYQDGSIHTMRLKNVTDGSILTYRFYPSENDLFNAFRLGEVNQIQVAQLPDNIDQWPRLKVTKELDTNQYIALFFNNEKLNVKQARQALAYATPKTNDKNERCLSPISPTSWAYNPDVKDYNFDSHHAIDLFDKNRIDKINLIVTDRKLLDLADSIRKSWKEVLNVDTTLTTATNNLNNLDFDVVLAFGQIPVDPDQYPFWHSTQTSTNITRFNNSRIDKLLEEGRATFDPIERKQIYQDFQRYLLEESPAVFLKFPTIYTITRI